MHSKTVCLSLALYSCSFCLLLFSVGLQVYNAGFSTIFAQWSDMGLNSVVNVRKAGKG